MPKKKDPAKVALAKFIVEKFMAPKSINWPRDRKIANQLIEKFPAQEFWEWIKRTKEATSMVVFLGEKGKWALEQRWKEWELTTKLKTAYQPQVFEKFEINLDVAPEVRENKKPRSILDFCK